jgi:UDP-N-acetylmuramoyl-L-alanyl-D-glutamate--2,6-diaminopimelate ligase
MLIAASGLSDHSATVRPGDLFFALSSEPAQLLVHAQQAVARGASAVWVEAAHASALPEMLDGVPICGVPALSESVLSLAASYYAQPAQSIRTVGITGTNGKTSCAYWGAQMYVSQGVSAGMIGTLGVGSPAGWVPTGYTTPTQVALQRALADLVSQQMTLGLIEASSHGLAQGRLESIPIELAVLTQITRDHLDYHGSIEAYVADKFRLFQGKALQAAVLNLDDPSGRLFAKRLAKTYPCITYALDPARRAMLSMAAYTAVPGGMTVSIDTPQGQITGEWPMLGRFNLSNLLAILGMAYYEGFDLQAVLTAASSWQPVPGRMMRLQGGDGLQVIIDYAHTPDALAQVLHTLRPHAQGKLWCVFGCGGGRDRGKRPEMLAMAQRESDRVVITADNPREEALSHIMADMLTGVADPRDIHRVDDRAQAIAMAIAEANSNDIIVVAGKGHETGQQVGSVTVPFDDAQQVEYALTQRAGR